MKREETVDFNIKTAWHAINQEALKNDITTSIGFVLLNINSTDGTPATKIAPLIGLESRSLVRMLKSMEEKELIYREADPVDRRMVRIFLTPLGQEKKDKAYETVLAFNQFVSKKIPRHELDLFFKVIQQISQLVEENNLSDIVASNQHYEKNYK